MIKVRRKGIYISREREQKLALIFTHLQTLGVYPKQDTPEDHLTALIDFALNKALEVIDQEARRRGLTKE